MKERKIKQTILPYLRKTTTTTTSLVVLRILNYITIYKNITQQID